MIGKIIVVGLVIAGGVVYLARKRGKSHTSSGNRKNSKFSSSSNKQIITVDKVNELSMEYLAQKCVDKIGANDISLKCFLMYSAPGKGFSNMDATKTLLAKIRNIYTNIPTDREVIIQVFCNPKTNYVQDACAITFETIEPALNDMFEQALYREGIIELEP